MRACLAVAMLWAVIALPASAAAVVEQIPTGQLPRTAEPLRYALDFTLDPRLEGFEGETRIQIRLHQPSDHLWLHGRDLKVAAVRWRDAAGAQGEGRYEQRNADGVARVEFGRVLPAQEIELSLSYSAAYSRSLDSIYKVSRGSEHYLVTQFEDIAARRAFPGFDEPSFKTPFEITLTVPEKTAAFANTRQIGDERGEPGTRTLKFAPTEALPTYLIAFAVGPWDISKTLNVPANDIRSKPFKLRVLGPRGSKSKLDYALKTTPELVEELERYFGIAYPFDKLDLVAAPDFAFGAMENAGLITFREVLLLLDEESSVDSRQDYFRVNAHELAHQWFGNYTTLAWWDDIWLNEAFATWMANKALHRLRPEDRSQLKQLNSTLAAMANDSLASARRIREPIRENGDISNAFDSITYQKGGGVLGMFESWIGEEKFREGIRLFLRRHARGNATSNDLISALTEASGQGVALGHAMRSFLDQPGIPLISTRLNCKQGKASMQLRQSRYLPLGSQGQQGARWKIPVCLRLGQGSASSRQCMLLEQQEQSFDLAYCPDWYLPNADGVGYYRYNMPAVDMSKLNLQLPQLAATEQIIHADALSAGFNRGDFGPDSVLQAMPALATSPLPNVALSLLDDFNWIRTQLADAGDKNALRRFAISLYQPKLDQLGWSARVGESPDDALMRQALLDFLALDVQGAEARQAMLSAGQDLLTKSGAETFVLEGADAETLGTALSVLAQEGGEPIVRHLMKALPGNRNPQQRKAMLQALGAVTDPALAALARDFVLGSELQLREVSGFYAAHKQRPENQQAYWNWMQNHFDKVIAPYPDFARNRVPGLASGLMCSKQQSVDLQNFFSAQLPKLPGAQRTLAQVIEGSQLCAALRSKHAAGQGVGSVARWIRSQAIPANGPTLADAVASPTRSASFRSRDLYRHPLQTLQFFEVQPQMSVVEVWPGAGWYTEILAPYLRALGQYTAAGFVTSGKEIPEWRKDAMKSFRTKLKQAPGLFDRVRVTELGSPGSWQAAPAASADRVLSFRNVHNWMSGDYEKSMFKSFSDALKPGGILGIVEHRAEPGTSLEQMKKTGYVTEEYVIRLAQEAGLRLLAKSEINANPRDTKNYPEGVWSLPPALRLRDQDRETYLSIGESDRMTLKFVKP